MTLDVLSGGDRSKWEYLLELDVIEFLNYMAFVKDKKAYEEEINGRRNSV